MSTISCIYRMGTSIQTINPAGIMEVLRLTGGETCTLTEDTNSKWTILICYGPIKSSSSFFKPLLIARCFNITFKDEVFINVLYQYIRRYHLISKNGQSELCWDKIYFNKLYLQRKVFLVTFLWHVHFFSHLRGQT